MLTCTAYGVIESIIHKVLRKRMNINKIATSEQSLLLFSFYSVEMCNYDFLWKLAGISEWILEHTRARPLRHHIKYQSFAISLWIHWRVHFKRWMMFVWPLLCHPTYIDVASESSNQKFTLKSMQRWLMQWHGNFDGPSVAQTIRRSQNIRAQSRDSRHSPKKQ